MNNLDNLNLPEDSLKDEQQGNAQLATETQQQAEPELTQDAVVQINEEIIMAETEEPVIATNNSGDDYSAPQTEEPPVFHMLPELEEDAEPESDEETDLLAAVTAPDYSALDKHQLLQSLKTIIYDKPVETIKVEIDAIKKAYYRSRQNEVIELKKQYIEKGGTEEAFDVPRDNDEDYFKELLNDYKARKAVYNEQLEVEKLANLDRKKEIIEKIGSLANRDESLTRTWEDFRELQRQWKNIGLVPAQEAQNILNAFQIQVEKFYDFIKIDKELRDLDLKKNLDLKLDLCNKAESLLLEPNVVEAYNKLQEYHLMWKEAGPVPNDKREEIWERFQAVTKQINKSHQDYFLKIKDELENNLQQKEVLCEQAEALLAEPCDTVKQWEDLTVRFSDLQQMWRGVGMVPRKSNAAVYNRFRNACNSFFESKKNFFSSIREEQNNNLQRKIDLCVLAESLKDSTDWRKTTADFLQLQKQWKEIGTVPRKHSQDVWLRFRKACDHYFNAKQEYFSNIDNEYATNLKLKLDLIKEVTDFHGTANGTENLNMLREFQNRWTEIGLVAFKDKDKLQKDFRTAISALYERLNIQKNAVDIEGFKQKVQMLADGGDRDTLRRERTNIVQKIKTLENDISLWENNMGFFSGKAESLLVDVKRKIEKAKAEIELLISQKKAIDLAEREFNKSEKKG